jgi:hypothetical protein
LIDQGKMPRMAARGSPARWRQAAQDRGHVHGGRMGVLQSRPEPATTLPQRSFDLLPEPDGEGALRCCAQRPDNYYEAFDIVPLSTVR